jgi:thiol-disulfide isomerase/thioredoxin/outer membrane lipoprotein-sorting protein
MRSFPARAALSLPLLLLLASAAPPAKPPGTRPSPGAAATVQARRAVAAVAERYRTLKGYELEGYAESRFWSSQGQQVNGSSLHFVVSRPSRCVSEVKNDQMTSRFVSDGDSVWTAVRELGQYVVQPIAKVRAESDSASLARQFDPAGDYAHLLDGVRDVRAMGRDTVHTRTGVVTCERYALTSAEQGPPGSNLTVHPRVLWVDPATHMVLLDSVRVDQEHPQMGKVYSVTITRMVVARPDPAFATDAFRFRPDPGLRRVRRFMRTSAEHASFEGQPAKDFTLDVLGRDKPVRLSEYRGKVVILDFWATWCGPCRGWLPIVAKAQKDYASRGLQVFAVNLREPETKVRDYLAKQKLEVPVLMDRTGSVGADYRADSIPLTVVIGRDGRVVRVLVGLHQEEDLRDVLAEAGLD